jgi:hypothetical protein
VTYPSSLRAAICSVPVSFGNLHVENKTVMVR